MTNYTQLLCLEDSYARECECNVVAVNGKEIVLDQTVFYPRGGGQPSDKGKIVSSGGSEFLVLNVLKKEGQIIHELEMPATFAAGDKVHCTIDWTRRYKLMRMHTAAHVLGATMYNDLGVLISGNQLEEEQSRFDFTMENFDRAKFEQIVEKVNTVLSQNIEIKTYTLPREEALKLPGVIKLAGALPPSISHLRIVEIPGVDLQADGGTHVRNLNEVGKMNLLKVDNKGKDNRRIYFTLSP